MIRSLQALQLRKDAIKMSLSVMPLMISGISSVDLFVLCDRIVLHDCEALLQNKMDCTRRKRAQRYLFQRLALQGSFNCLKRTENN